MNARDNSHGSRFSAFQALKGRDGMFAGPLAGRAPFRPWHTHGETHGRARPAVAHKTRAAGAPRLRSGQAPTRRARVSVVVPAGPERRTPQRRPVRPWRRSRLRMAYPVAGTPLVAEVTDWPAAPMRRYCDWPPRPRPASCTVRNKTVRLRCEWVSSAARLRPSFRIPNSAFRIQTDGHQGKRPPGQNALDREAVMGVPGNASRKYQVS